MHHNNPASLTEAQRDEIRRSQCAPGAIKVTSKRALYTAYLYTNASGEPCARAFAGKAIKPAIRLRYRCDRSRASHIAEFAQRLEAAEDRKIERRAARNSGHQLKAGDVLSAMWGYEQTNIDYYEVTKLIGKTMVEVREIASERKGDAYMQGECTPVPGHYIGAPKRRKADGTCVRVDGIRRASKEEPTAYVGGRPLYRARRWTAYA